MIRVQKNTFHTEEELKLLINNNLNIGGVCSFIGLVRDVANEATISAMTLEHYPEMTIKALTLIDNEANKRWPLEASLIIHRYGRLLPGDKIVMVATAAKHRHDAFESCQFLIDWLKTQAPFWKLEETQSGSKWVAARDSDAYAAKRWGKKDNALD